MTENKTVFYDIGELDFHAREAVNMVRASAQMAGQDNRIFGVTSAMANEGKSSLAFRLAQSLSGLKGKRVAMVDCDIRNSKVKKRLKVVQKTVGLSEYLCGLVGIEDIVYPTQNEQLDIVFCGREAPNPSELLSHVSFSQLLAELKSRYDFVIVDMPPVNLVVDATIVAPLCDMNIIVVECGVTDKRELTHAVNVLERAEAKMLGLVLNKVDSKQNRYGKYGRYGRYGKYGRFEYRKYGEYAAKND